MKPLPPFALERFFDVHEFSTEILLCASDVEPWTLGELLELASEDQQTRWENLSLGYTHAAGHPSLRNQIAKLYDSLEPDDIITFSGAEEGIFAIANVLLGPGTHAIAVVPTYQSLFEVATGTGADVTKVALGPDWSFPLDDIAAAIRPDTRLMIINSPNNPTGAVVSGDDLAGLLRLCTESGVTLLCDEVYRFLMHDERHPPPAADMSPRSVSLGVMSKSFALAGLRIGWIATGDRELIARLAAFKDYTTICSSAPSELLSEIALDNAGTILKRSRAIVAANLEVADGFFHKWDGAFRWTRPAGGTTAFPEFTSPYDIDEFAQQLLREEGVLLAPGSLFSWPGNHFRIGLGRSNFAAGIERLDRFTETHFS